jgi:hypothetical protein
MALLPFLAQRAAAQPETTASCTDRCVNGKDCAVNPFTPCLPHVYQTNGDIFPKDGFIKLLPVDEPGTLHLAITADGTNSDGPNDGTADMGGGTPCIAGPGYGENAPPGPLGLDSDHLCAFSAIIDIPNIDGLPAGRFVSFTVDPDLDTHMGLMTVPAAGVFAPGVTRLGINFVTRENDSLPPATDDEEDVDGVHRLGDLVVEVLDPGIVVWVRQGDAIRSANAKAVELGEGETLQNVLEDRMSPHALAIAVPVPEPGAYLSLFSMLAGLGGLHQLRRRRSQARSARSER